MIYHGVILSITFARNTITSERYTYVSDPLGFPIERIGSSSYAKLYQISKEQNHWCIIGTWPVAQHPPNVWQP